MNEREVNPAQAFASLKLLVGHWSGKNSEGVIYTVSYTSIACDSSIVERWIFANGGEALTVYHMDGQSLIAAHFCPHSNQQRLRLSSKLQRNRLNFEIFDGSNIAVPGSSHQCQFDTLIASTTEFSRGETYKCFNDGTFEYESVDYTRS